MIFGGVDVNLIEKDLIFLLVVCLNGDLDLVKNFIKFGVKVN